MPWNLERKRQLGERYLRMARAGSLDEARAILQDEREPEHRRCLAARAIGWLGGEEDRNVLWRFEDLGDLSPFARVCWRATMDLQDRQTQENRVREAAEAHDWMNKAAAGSEAGLIAILNDRSRCADERSKAAGAIGTLKCREAAPALISALAEGEATLSGSCSSALITINTRRHGRRLMQVARRAESPVVRFWAVYTLWWLRETRAQDILIRVTRAEATEPEDLRSIATEALGNTCRHHRSQVAIVERLFDKSADIRFSALCALGHLWGPFPAFVIEALKAKLDDPDRVDDHRVIAEQAAELLRRSNCQGGG